MIYHVHSLGRVQDIRIQVTEHSAAREKHPEILTGNVSERSANDEFFPHLLT